MVIIAKFFLDQRHQKKDGTYPIKLRLTINRKSIEIASGYTINDSCWSGKAEKVKSRCPGIQNVTRLNNLLQRQKSHALEVLMKLEEENELERLSLKEIKTRISGKREAIYVI